MINNYLSKGQKLRDMVAKVWYGLDNPENGKNGSRAGDGISKLGLVF